MDISAGSVDGFPERTKRIVTWRDRSFLVVRLDDGFYAVDNACPHHGALLDWSPVRLGPGGTAWVTCPLHAWEIDVRTGEVYGMRPTAATFAVRQVGDQLLISVPDDPPKDRQAETVEGTGKTESAG